MDPIDLHSWARRSLAERDAEAAAGVLELLRRQVELEARCDRLTRAAARLREAHPGMGSRAWWEAYDALMGILEETS